MRCEESVKILEVLRLSDMGLSQRQIADSVKCGKTTVRAFRNAGRQNLLAFTDLVI